MPDVEPPRVVKAADDLYETLRTINHMTSPGSSLPAPIVYQVLGNFKGIEYLLSQALNQIAAGLGKSLDTHDVYEDDGRDPIRSNRHPSPTTSPGQANLHSNSGRNSPKRKTPSPVRATTRETMSREPDTITKDSEQR